MTAKFNVGDRLDVSQEFAIYREAIVESIFTKKNGSVYYKIRGIKQDGSVSAKQHDLWEESPGLRLIN